MGIFLPQSNMVSDFLYARPKSQILFKANICAKLRAGNYTLHMKKPKRLFYMNYQAWVLSTYLLSCVKVLKKPLQSE